MTARVRLPLASRVRHRRWGAVDLVGEAGEPVGGIVTAVAGTAVEVVEGGQRLGSDLGELLDFDFESLSLARAPLRLHLLLWDNTH